MLARIVDFSLRFRGLIASLAVITTVYGLFRLSRAGLDIFPEFSPKSVIVQTEAPGMSTEQVEILVTQPIENALAGLIGLDHVRSESIQGLSVVTAIFKDDTNLILDRQFVAERLTDVRRVLPPTAATPVVVPLASSSATVRTIGLQSDTVDLMTLRDLVDATIVPNLLSIPGVADVNVFGGDIRSLQIRLKPEALRRFNISVNEIVEATRDAAAPGAALGALENTNQTLSLQVVGQPQSVAALGQLVVKRSGEATVTLADVASIAIAPAPAIGAAQIMGKPAIVMMIIGQFGANTLTVSKLLQDSLAEFERNLAPKGITLYSSLFVPANYIETSLHNISEHIVVGGAFVLVILILFLFDARAAFVSAVAIPLSLLGAVFVLLEAGVNLNIMVLGGLAIALGEVVDDAIIDTENIYRRLRENQGAAAPRALTAVIFGASLEVRGSVVYASFIVALVFVPLLTLSGVAGRLFAPLGVSYILAILASLGVALTVTPALCCLLLGGRRIRRHDPPLIRLLKPVYARGLRLIGRHPGLAIVTSLSACAAAIAILPTLGSQFLPPLREGHYIVHTTGLPGTSLAESIRLGSRVTAEILQTPGVKSVSQWAGRAEHGADTYGSHYSEYEVALAPMSGGAQQAVLDHLRAVFSAFPGLLFETNTFLTERVDETISGYTAPVVVNIYGRDLTALDDMARQIAAIMQETKGATEVQTRSAVSVPLAQVQLDMTRLARWGVRPQDVVTVLEATYAGVTVGNVIEENRVMKVLVIANPQARDELAEIGDLPIRTMDGGLVPLRSLASIEQVAGHYNILHRAGQRLQAVTCNVHGRDLVSFMDELKRRIHAQVSFASDMHVEFTGSSVEQQQAREDLILDSLLAGIGVVVLIYLALGNLRHVVVILLNLPFSLAGGVVAVLVAGDTLSIGSVVGFVTLFGITVRNSIMLVSHYQHLVRVEGLPWNLDTVVKGAQERLPSIAMTALVTALAMLPIATNSDNAGREIMGPMASIIIGGLFSSAILNLMIMPAMMLRFGRFAVGEAGRGA